MEVRRDVGRSVMKYGDVGRCGVLWKKVWGSALGCGGDEERCRRHGDVGEVRGNVEKSLGKCVGV